MEYKTMKKATEKQINYLQKLGAIFDPENITKREASLLIGRTLKANKEQGTNKATAKDTEPKQEKTLQQLLIEYNCGTTEDSEGRFYKGNNAHNLPSYYEDASEWLKAIKKIILKEFNIKILASKEMATYTPSYTFTLKTTPQEFFKSFEELKAEKVSNWEILKIFQNYNEGLRSVFMNWASAETIAEILNDDDTVKLFYNWTIENIDGQQMLQYITNRNRCETIKPIYVNLIEFLSALMTSYNYDHTGQFMGDCDYVDCSFFYSINWENLHEITRQSKPIGELYKKSWREYSKLYGDTLCELKNKIYHSTTAEDLRKNITKYNNTKIHFINNAKNH